MSLDSVKTALSDIKNFVLRNKNLSYFLIGIALGITLSTCALAADVYIDGVKRNVNKVEIWTQPKPATGTPAIEPTPTPIWPIACPANTTCIQKDWPTIPTTLHEMSSKSILSIAVTTGTSTQAGAFALVPTSYNGTWTTVAIAKEAGSFNTDPQCKKSGSEISVRWAQGVTSPRYCSLKLSTTYYVNIAFRGETNPATTCALNKCGFYYKNN